MLTPNKHDGQPTVDRFERSLVRPAPNHKLTRLRTRGVFVLNRSSDIRRRNTVHAFRTINRRLRVVVLSMFAICVITNAGPLELVAAEPVDVVQLVVNPARVMLSGQNAKFTLLVHARTRNGQIIDLTRKANLTSKTPKIVSVRENGIILGGEANGSGLIEVSAYGKKVLVEVVRRESQFRRPINFENDVVPILSKFGCNASGCHGKAEGQNGFKLSVFGFNPSEDHVALTQEARGRRLFLPNPTRSLFLTKASGGLPHGGGVRIRRSSEEYRLLRDWVSAGMPMGEASDPKVVSIQVTPSERLVQMKAEQQLRVVATYSDGHQVDVTGHAKFRSNNEAAAKVNESGLVSIGETPGDVAIMASYMGAVDLFRAIIPRSEPVLAYPKLRHHNFIDKLVDAKLRKLNIVPSGVCSDADFLRRTYLDIIGTLPTASETVAFLADTDSKRRQNLVSRLLKRPEYADYWALKWSDLLRVDRQALGYKGAYNYYKWIRDSFAANKPYDQFARKVVTAEGTLQEAPAGHLYQVVKNPGDLASTVTQVFLGMRIECAQCHHHPFDRWSQTDYYGMKGFFTQVGFKKAPQGSMLVALKDSKTKHPRSGEIIYAHALLSPKPDKSPDGDRRKILSDWMTSPENPWFAKNLVNRVWANFLGRGMIEPVDDIRLTNPPTNPELLDALAKHFVASGYDLHQLIRTITESRTYQLTTKPNSTNELDEQNYSRALLKQMQAEVLLDAICQVTGVEEKFAGVPAGSRAIQLWDSHVPHYFLKLFGRPVRSTPCDCERTAETTVGQVLHVLNSPGIQSKLASEGGAIAKLTRQNPTDNGKLIRKLYLTFYNRYPESDEITTASEYLDRYSSRRRQAAEDIAWSMMNSLEFMFNH